MKLNKIAIWAIIGSLAAAFLATGCKDDDDDTEYFYLSGSLSFTCDPFIKQGTEIILVPKGVSHPDGEDIGYSWKVSDLMTKYDTTKVIGGTGDGSFDYTFGDSLGTFTIYCNAFATGYVSSSHSTTVTVVDPSLDGTITNTGVGSAGDGRVTDPRDNKTIYYRTHNGTDWTSINMSYDKMGIPYSNCECMSDILGRYYSWEEAQSVCPAGWTLPSDADWIAFGEAFGCEYESSSSTISGFSGKLMADCYFNGEKFWEFWPEVKITNDTHFAAVPSGYANLDSFTFWGTSEYACFWTSDTVEMEGEEYGVYRYIVNSGVGNPDLLAGKADKKSFGASVRCIRKR